MTPLTKEQAVIVSAYTGCLICNRIDLHNAIEEKLGPAVWSHQLRDETMVEQIKQAFKNDFLALAPINNVAN